MNDDILKYTSQLELEPNNYRLYVLRGNAKAISNDFQGAIADYNRAIAITPDYYRAYFNRGVAKFDNQDVRGAIADYQLAIGLNEAYFRPYSNLATAYMELKDPIKAYETLTKLVQLINTQKLSAEDIANRGISLDRLYVQRGLVCKAAHNFTESIEDFTRAIDLNSEAETYYLRGDSYLSLGNIILGSMDLERAHDLDPANPRYLVRPRSGQSILSR
jgi:tetratricopeptide (TPR) repeat protein